MKLNIQLFASGSFEGTSTASKGRIRIDWSSTPSDAINNKSSVSATVYIWRTNNYNTEGTFSGNLTINGNSIYISKKRSNWNTEPKEVGSYTIDVPHNEDGTKTCNISCELTQTGTSLAGTYTASQNVVLDTIPRASVFNSLSMVVNNDSSITITANITRRNASFTDTLTICNTNFELNNGSNTITLSDSVNPTAKARFYQIMGNNTQASYTAILTTKSSGTQVGNTSTQTAIVSLPSYSISIGTITSSDDNANNYIRSGSTYKVSDFTSTNTYLQGFSNPRLSFTLGSSSGYLYGNTINISGGASASGLGLGNNSVALGTNFTGGSKTLTASDGRKTTSGSITLTRKDWSTPSVSIVLERQSATGQTIEYEITYNFTSVSGGLTPKLSASYTYNGTTYTLYSEVALSNTSGTLTGTFNLVSTDDYKYPISATTTLTDTIDYQVSSNTQIPGGKPAIYTYKDSSANNKVDIYGDLDVDGKITNAKSIEVSNTTPYIDFHYNNSSSDYTSRIIESSSGTLSISGNLTTGGTISAGSTITTSGNLTSSKSGKYITIANENTAFAHYQTDAQSGHWFNKNVYVQGDIYAGASYNMKVPVIKQLYSNTTGAKSVNIGESVGNYNFYLIVWGLDYTEKRSDVYYPGFGNFDFTQFANGSYWSVYRFTSSGNTITMTKKDISLWADSAKMYKIIGIKF